MRSVSKVRLAFASALAVLLLTGVGTTLAFSRLFVSQQMVAHTYEVQIALGNFDSALTAAARARFNYVGSGSDGDLQRYQARKVEVMSALGYVRALVKDNPHQLQFCDQLATLASQRLSLLDSSVELRQSGKTDAEAQARITQQNVVTAANVVTVMEQMQAEERALLGKRKNISATLLVVVLATLCAMFALSALLFWVHYELLRRELHARERTEENARQLSGRVLQMQDEERRRFARDLHDGLGQTLAMAKMHAVLVQQSRPGDESLAEVEKLLDDAIQETRTISHLLHPPLLDEVGFASAARWYVEGFAQRSGIALTIDIADNIGRLPRAMELTLFRVLQESLTNIHRHSNSQKAAVSLKKTAVSVVLRVQDFGKGIPPDALQRFLRDGTFGGVGLAGMRERVYEQSGNFEIQSDGRGTTIQVTIPFHSSKKQGEPLVASAD